MRQLTVIAGAQQSNLLEQAGSYQLLMQDDAGLETWALQLGTVPQESLNQSLWVQIL